MKLGNLIRDQKQQLTKNKKKVMLIKKEKEQENHVVAIKNKLYDNSALEESTQRSSMAEQYMSNSMYQAREAALSQEQLNFVTGA